MKTKNFILIIVLILLASAAGWWFSKNPQTIMNPDTHMHKDTYYCPMHPQVTSDKPGICPICQMKLVKKENSSPSTPAAQSSAKKILYWTDPMIPGYKSGQPGKSPMGMDMVPVYEENNSAKGSSQESVPDHASISLDHRKQQFIGVKTAVVQKKTLTKTIHAYGYAAHDLDLYNAQLAYIDAWRQYYAFLSRRRVQGEYRQDWREYYLNPPEGRWRSADELKAQQNLINAEYELTHMGLNDSQLAQLRKIKYGQPWVQPDLLFFQEDHPVWVYAQILESDLGFIDVGQKALVTIPDYHETTEGIVRNVSLRVDPATRTTQVRVELPKYRGELKINMYVNVDMPVELEEAPVVPREAIVDNGLNKIIFVQTKEGIFEPRIIQTGHEGDGMMAVKSGLNEGEMIVVSGNFLLDSESRLQASLMGGQ